MVNIDEILRYFPNKIYQIFFNLFQENNKIIDELQEIRMRTDRPIILRLREKDFILQYNIEFLMPTDCSVLRALTILPQY